MADGKFGFPFGPTVGARYADQGGLVPQGISAELIADKWGLTREDLDAFGVRSRSSAPRGRPTRVASSARSSPVLDADGEHDDASTRALRDTTLETLGQAEAGVPVRGGRRPGHRRQLVADHRRRRGGADHERGEGGRSSG